MHSATCSERRRRLPGRLLLGLALVAGVTVFGTLPVVAAPPEISAVDLELDGPAVNIDDACFWVNPADPTGALVFTTAKRTKVVEAYSVETGALVATIPGFTKPNNCWVEGDLLLTTDRNAHNVKVHHLPDLRFVRTFAADTLGPMGIAALHTRDGKTLVYVSDEGDASVHAYDLATFAPVRTFTTGFGLLIEPLATDDLYQRLFVAREEEGGHGIGLFTPEGTLVREFGGNTFAFDTEGIALYRCGEGGYLLASDQHLTATEFEVFDRVSLQHLGTFLVQDGSGEYIDATDGIEILQTPTPRFPNGVLAACDGCGDSLPDETDLVSWDRIADVLGLERCPDGMAPDCTVTSCTRRLLATADASVNAATPDANLGATASLEVDADPDVETLVRFDVPDLTGFDLGRATLRLTADSAVGSDGPAGGAVAATSADWSESTVTWATRPRPIAPPLGTIGAITRAQGVEVDVRDAVRRGAQNFVVTATSPARVRYRSREAEESPPALVLTLRKSTAPELTLTSPTSGLVVMPGEDVTLAATASDAEDGDLSASIHWRSDRDGVLGEGATVHVTTLHPGPHTLTADVTDAAGLHARASVGIVVNTPPVVAITAPARDTSVPGGTGIACTATATDAEEGDLAARITWASDHDGLLGRGATVATLLSEGTHHVTAAVHDTPGAGAMAQVTIEVTPAPPELRLVAPTSGVTVLAGEPLALAAVASDFADGDLRAAVTWASDVQGALGRGATLVVTSLAAGAHTLTASVTDSSGLTATASVPVTLLPNVLTFPALADAYVSAATPGQNFGSARTLQADAIPVLASYLRFQVEGTTAFRIEHATLRLAVSDARGATSVSSGSVYQLADAGWDEQRLTFATRPPLDGDPLATGGTAAKGAIIELDVTPAVAGDGPVAFGLASASGDAVKYHSREAAGRHPELVVRLRPARPSQPPTVTITAPGDDAIAALGAPITLAASATDAEDGDLSAAIQWRSDVSGRLGDGARLTLPGLSFGVHHLTASVRDTSGKSATASATLTVGAGTLALAPVADATVKADLPGVNGGSTLTLQADGDPVRRAYLRFAVAGVAAGRATHATLRLTVRTEPSSGGVTGGSVHRLAPSPWTESAITFSACPAVDTPALATAGRVVEGQAVDFDLTGSITGDGVYELALATPSTDRVAYNAREAGVAGPRLLLAVE